MCGDDSCCMVIVVWCVNWFWRGGCGLLVAGKFIWDCGFAVFMGFVGSDLRKIF